MNREGTLMHYNHEKAIELAYDLGHHYELEAHFCPQASLAALMDVFHFRDDSLFKSIFGFHGGSGNSGIGPCGALVGGISAIGYFYGRSRTEFDMMAENCAATALVKKLVGRFSDEFDGLRCRDCQKKMLGREIDFSKERIDDSEWWETINGTNNIRAIHFKSRRPEIYHMLVEPDPPILGKYKDIHLTTGDRERQQEAVKKVDYGP